jgi:hypothetical protein
MADVAERGRKPGREVGLHGDVRELRLQ